jgi:hypothetical protein
MADGTNRRLEAETLVVGYAMSRLDVAFLLRFDFATWREAFNKTAELLTVASATMKNLRDEYDPLHSNARKGWRNRPPRSDRLQVLGELCELSDEALIELVSRILARDEESTAEAIDSLVEPVRVTHNVAERLLTGRKAEEHFIRNYRDILAIGDVGLVDMRQSGQGYDFGLDDDRGLAIEVKGLRKSFGPILFTDREWREAAIRRESYWLVVIGGIDAIPGHSLIRDPTHVLDATCRYQRSLVANWHAQVSIT